MDFQALDPEFVFLSSTKSFEARGVTPPPPLPNCYSETLCHNGLRLS